MRDSNFEYFVNCDKSSPTIAAIWALFVAKALVFIASRCTCIVNVVIHRAQYRHKGTFLPGPKMLHHMNLSVSSNVPV